MENKNLLYLERNSKRTDCGKRGKEVSRCEAKLIYDIKSLQSSKAAMGPLRGWGGSQGRWGLFAESLNESSDWYLRKQLNEGHILETGIHFLEGKSEMLKGFHDWVRADSWAIRTIRSWQAQDHVTELREMCKWNRKCLLQHFFLACSVLVVALAQRTEKKSQECFKIYLAIIWIKAGKQVVPALVLPPRDMHSPVKVSFRITNHWAFMSSSTEVSMEVGQCF